jgi:hypothetical protein
MLIKGLEMEGTCNTLVSKREIESVERKVIPI